MRLKILALAVILLCGNHPKTHAAIVVSIQPSVNSIVVPTAGNTTNVTFVVSMAATSGIESLLSYNLPVDIAPPGGIGLPTGITIARNAISLFPIPGGVPFSPNSFAPEYNPSEGDFLGVAGELNFASPVAISTVPQPIFQFTAVIDSSVLPMEYTASIVRGALFAIDPQLTNSAVGTKPAGYGEGIGRS